VNADVVFAVGGRFMRVTKASLPPRPPLAPPPGECGGGAFTLPRRTDDRPPPRPVKAGEWLSKEGFGVSL